MYPYSTPSPPPRLFLYIVAIVLYFWKVRIHFFVQGGFMMKSASFLFFFIFFWGIQTTTAASSPWTGKTDTAFAGGEGSMGNPYQIATPEQLKYLAHLVEVDSSKGLFFILTDDIVWNTGDASTWSSVSPQYTWQAMGTDSVPARLTLFGNGHSISGLYIDTEDSLQGLFGAFAGKLSHFTLKNSYIRGGNQVGGIAGSVNNDGGKRLGIIDSCTNEAMVTGDSSVGGIVGYIYNDSSMVYGNLNAGSVTGISNVGGIVGKISTKYGTGGLHRCHNSGTVSGTNNVGGIVGYRTLDVANRAALQLCYNTGAVTGELFVGGIVGNSYLDRYTEGSNDSNYAMTNVYNLGSVTGTEYVGGLAGYYGDTWRAIPVIRYGYNGGKVTGISDFQGLVGNVKPSWTTDNFVIISFVYNFGSLLKGDALVKEAASDSMIAAKQDSLGPDFVPDTLAPLVNNGFPVLALEHPNLLFSKGSGTAKDPFLIKNRVDLFHMAKYAASQSYELRHSYYIQSANIALDTTKFWTPIPEFYGNYNGNGHQITGLRIQDSTTGNNGFFSVISSAKISNLSIMDARVKGFSYAGILAGEANYSSVINIHVSGDVTAKYDGVGGIIGLALDLDMRNSSNEAAVSGRENIGGLVGRHIGGNILFSRNSGTIQGNNQVGGLVGEATAILSYVYNRGAVTGTSKVGGLIGTGYHATQFAYSTGKVTGQTETGALQGTSGSGDRYSSSLTSAYFSSDQNSSLTAVDLSSNNTKTENVEGKTLAALKATSMLDLLGIGFIADTTGENDGYPIFNLFEGSGTEEDPFLIADAQDLWLLAELTRYKWDPGFTMLSYKMTADINLKSGKDKPWTPIGYCVSFLCGDTITGAYFGGTFDGGNHTISGIYFQDTTVYGVGIFSYAYRATIHNLGVENATLSGAGYVGGIVGFNSESTISNCWNKGSSLFAHKATGGIVGENHSFGDITGAYAIVTNSFNTGSVAGGRTFGGIAGLNQNDGLHGAAIIANCYNRGAIINADTSVAPYWGGGIVGENSNKENISSSLTRIYNTYNTGMLFKQTPYAYSTYGYSGKILGGGGDLIQYSANYFLADDKEDTTAIGQIYPGSTANLNKSGWAMLESEMKSRSFVKLLGSAFSYDSQEINDGYPILTETVPDILSIPIKPAPTKSSYATAWTIQVQDKAILLTGIQPGIYIAVYDLKGGIQWQGKAPASTTFRIIPRHSGLYIVKTASQAKTVFVH